MCDNDVEGTGSDSSVVFDAAANDFSQKFKSCYLATKFGERYTKLARND